MSPEEEPHLGGGVLRARGPGVGPPQAPGIARASGRAAAGLVQESGSGSGSEEGAEGESLRRTGGGAEGDLAACLVLTGLL